MFAVYDSQNQFITNVEGDILVSDPEAKTQFWVPANQIHELSPTNVGSDNENGSANIEPFSQEPEEDTISTEEKSLSWSHKDTLLLIDFRLDEGAFEKMMKKHVWQRITKELNEKATKTFTSLNVENKWKALKRTYKNIKLKNSQSGQKRKYWDYFTFMDEVMGKKPETNAPVTPVPHPRLDFWYANPKFYQILMSL